MIDLFAGHPARQGHDLDDDQRAGGDPARLLRAAPPRSRASAARHLGGTIQTDILKEYIAQKEWCFPIEPAMRLVTDMVEWCAERMPRWHPISISGYHIREAGSTAQQELAFTLKDGFTYVEQALERGLDVDEFAPRLSFFFNAHIDFFEEIAKYRAARRIWAREMRDTYGAKRAESLRMRFHTQTAGRVADRPAAARQHRPDRASRRSPAVLGGTQSLHTNSFDEALALPTEEAVRVALRTQQVIAHETGVTNTVDPLGGSYFVEKLTDEMEAAAYELLRPHRRARRHGRGDQARASPSARSPTPPSATSRRSTQRERIVVGVNDYRRTDEEEPSSTAPTRRSSASRPTACRRPAPRRDSARRRARRWPS